MKDIILDFTKEELSKKIKPSFRAKQIYSWIYHKYVNSFFAMKNIPVSLQQELDENYIIDSLKVEKVEQSSDGTKKYLFKLRDGRTIETVLLLMQDRELYQDGHLKHYEKWTICISTQVGCKINCSFCLTAKGGFIRNLTAGEIVSQLQIIKKENDIGSNRKFNIVYMGMGEPLDNLSNVVKSVKIFTDKDGMDISPNRITISTSGLTNKIYQLGELDLGINLAISLHSVDDETRDKLIPINKVFNIKSIIEAVKKFPINLRKKVMFEYLMIKDLNDDLTHAKKLMKLLDGIDAKLNLIYFNPYEGTEFKRPSEKNMIAFSQYFNDRKVFCSIRDSKGLDILAACGQLKEQVV